MREKGADRNDLLDRLAGDERLGLSAEDLAALVAEPLSFTGAAVAQVDEVVRRVERLVVENPAAAAYRPGAIL
jgi:adenylosuccinate lyase